MRGTVVVFFWVTAHTGIVGNNRVDKLTEQAMKKENIDTVSHKKNNNNNNNKKKKQ